MLEPQPSAPTKEKRFAYSLYLDVLMLMVKISRSIEKRGGFKPLENTRFIRKILADERFKSIENKYRMEDFPLDSIVKPLSDAIKDSALYKNMEKDGESGKNGDLIWARIMNMIVYPNSVFNNAIAKRDNFTLAGVDRMKELLDSTFKAFYASHDNIDEALKTLRDSMDMARELYFRLLTLPVELTALRENQLEENREKFLPTEEDLNPNLRFVENGLIAVLSGNEQIKQYLKRQEGDKTNSIGWRTDHSDFLRRLLSKIMESELYREYMDFPATDFTSDCEFWRNIYKNVILRDEDFLELLETESVFWNDDLDIIGTFVLKTFKRIMECDENPILPMYKDDDDARFGAELFTYVVRDKDLYRRYINDSLDSATWDSERLAFMDVVIIMTALAEILNYPKIPLTVSINEYIEIAKSYSTPKSGGFVNGLLASILGRLKEEGKLLK